MKNFMMKTLAGLFGLSISAAFAAGEAKNVIFFLGDGMGPTTVTAARIYKYGEAGQLSMNKLDRTAKIKTYSNDAQTTDSAPSMSAYMTGVKANNEVVSMSTDTLAKSPKADGTNNCGVANGGAVTTILEMAKAKGKLVGAVTTTRVTHATPAATYAHTCHRDAEIDIAAQLVPTGLGYNSQLGTGLDVLIGGGSKFFLPTASGGKRSDGRNLLTELQSQGYTYVSSRTALNALNKTATPKLLALFHTDHMDYELDRVKKSLDQPSLAEMTLSAIDVLNQGKEGYFLMVEGGRIDHALHGTNAKRVMEDTIAFDDAIKAALGKVDLSNTLIVVTADHDHTMTMNGYAKKGNPILDIARGNDGLPLKDADGKSYTTLVFGNGPNRPDMRADVDSAVALGDDYLQETSVRTNSETHGGGDVMLMATGAGAKIFKGTLDNTKVFGLLKSAFGF